VAPRRTMEPPPLRRESPQRRPASCGRSSFDRWLLAAERRHPGMTSIGQLEGPVTPVRGRDDLRQTVLVVGVITLVALVLRLAAFRGSFFGDELFTYEVATRRGLSDVLAGVRSDLEITPPLFFFIAWAFQKLGDPLVWLRVPSLLAGVATVPFV